VSIADLASAELIDPVASAEAAGLRYVTDEEPGIRRRRAGKGWAYTWPDGRPVRQEATIARIKSLAIPPAWREVWICPQPEGHLQATGRDARGRKQYRYHPRWREVRDAVKYDRLIAFAEALTQIRERVDDDLRRPGLCRERVLATVVRLLEETLIRVGNEEYRRQNGSYGLTTLHNGHVDVSTTTIRFRFRGKHGKTHEITLSDRRLARIVKRCREIPGQRLFQYVDDLGEHHTISSEDVNTYLREISGESVTAKDFRTWAGTVLAARLLTQGPPATTVAEAKRQVAGAIAQVAAQLGNTVPVCRRCYVHPTIVEAFQAGALTLADGAPGQAWADTPGAGPPDGHPGLTAEEAAVLVLLRRGAETTVLAAPGAGEPSDTADTPGPAGGSGGRGPRAA
jgi:DNA topoisomerase-1